MNTETRFHRAAVVVLAAALIATLSVALTGGDRAGAVEGPVDVVYVATGRNFPDALAGATLAATVGAPLLTVEPDLPLPATTVAALQSLDPDRIVILGGPVAVSDAVRGALADFARSGSVTRLQGTDRHETAARIADALPDKVHDSDLLDGLDSTAFLRSGATAANAGALDGLDSTQIGAVFGLRDRDLGRETAPTGFDSVRTLQFTAPTDGFLLVTGSVFVANTDAGGTNGTGVYLLYDWDGEATPGSLQASTIAIDDLRLDASGGTQNATTSSVATAIPVTAGPHTIDLAMDGGSDLEYNAPTLSALFSPNGDTSPVGVTVPAP